jgi:hypothetical protein
LFILNKSPSRRAVPRAASAFSRNRLEQIDAGEACGYLSPNHLASSVMVVAVPFKWAEDRPTFLRNVPCPVGQITDRSSRVLCLIKRGVLRSSRTLGEGCDGRDGAAGRMASTRTAKSCGLDASTLASTGDDASHHAGMVARKPITRESTKQAVKTNRVRECRFARRDRGD